MKKITIYIMTAVSLLSFVPTTSKAEANINSKEKIEMTAEQAQQAQVMMNRLEEIKAMDKSNMTRTEKKALRKEVKTIKAAMSELSGGVYLSVGAIIIIVLLLILLL
jgi:nicotinate-nucleotide pyrophosphorylase